MLPITPHVSTALRLGRVSNLPTVWSNCIAGWWLGGGGSISDLLVVAAGGTLMYVAGTTLNDAADADFDRKYRPERPIPSGKITSGQAWALGWALLAAGAFLAAMVAPLWVVLLLAGAIVLYDLVHKKTAWGTVLMAGCRFLLYLTAAGAAQEGITRFAILAGLGLAVYILAISLIARTESLPGSPSHHPAALLTLAPLFSAPAYRAEPLFLIAGAIALAWLAYGLRPILRRPPAPAGPTVGRLLAGICLWDAWMCGPGAPPAISGLLFGLFLLALLAQKTAPAT